MCMRSPRRAIDVRFGWVVRLCSGTSTRLLSLLLCACRRHIVALTQLSCAKIEYVFSDKTGTLTRNEMEFKRCAIGGVSYGLDEEASVMGSNVFAKAKARRAGQVVDHGRCQYNSDPAFTFTDPRLLRALESGGPQAALINEFLTALVVCQRCVRAHMFVFVFVCVCACACACVFARVSMWVWHFIDHVRSVIPEKPRVNNCLLAATGAGATPAVELSPPGVFRPEVSARACAGVACVGTRVPQSYYSDIVYQASSPDEAALVTAAKCFGYRFVERVGPDVVVFVRGERLVYSVLAENAFTSTRKRMSVLVRCPDGSLKLYVKGADNVMMPLLAVSEERGGSRAEFARGIGGLHGARSFTHSSVAGTPTMFVHAIHATQSVSSLGPFNASVDTLGEGSSLNIAAQDPNAIAAGTSDLLAAFASTGLRTLVVAGRVVDSAEAEVWLGAHGRAANAMVGREAACAEAAEAIEKDLSLYGASAIEDKLQNGVPDAIAALARAGCKIWMLTGDKEETAINIGRSCRLITPDMNVIVMNSPDREICLQQIAAARGG